jgi:hypothetical protein
MNSFAAIDPDLIDVFPAEHDGYPDELAAEDTTAAVREACGSAARDFPRALWIEPRDWADKARDNDQHKTWPVNYIDRYTNQDPTHECTCHSLSRCVEGARNRQRGVSFPDGPKKGFRYAESSEYGSVWLSPLSVYAEANPGQWGGANVRQVMEIACRRGMLPEKIQPRDYGFKHTLQGTTGRGNDNQSSGDWVSVSRFPEGWKETAAWFKPIEVIFPEQWEQAVCLVLHGMFVGVGRSGHAIPWGQWNASEQVMAYPDSYDVTRYDSLRTVKSAWQGSFAIASITVPDDWTRPAGSSDYCYDCRSRRGYGCCDDCLRYAKANKIP